MNEEYEEYYQKGGTYVIPTEVFNQLLEENQQLKECYNRVVHESTEFESKVYKLESVLDEIREYIEKHTMVDYDEFEYISTSPKVMLQILDKAGNNDSNV